MFLFRRPRLSEISPADAIAGRAKGEIVVVDVREHAEVAVTGKAKGAIHIPLTELRAQADPGRKGLTTNTKIAVYCASGGRSEAAVKILRELGYRDSHNIGGLTHWTQAGGAIEPL